MSESFIDELDLEELIDLEQVEINVGTNMSRIKHRVGGKVWVMFINE